MNSIEYALCASEEISQQLRLTDAKQLGTFEQAIVNARRVFVFGSGRTFLILKLFAMRLMHFGFDSFVVGDVCTPAIGPGDLLVVGSCSGSTPSVFENVIRAKKAGASIALVTFDADGDIAKASDILIVLGHSRVNDGALSFSDCNGEYYDSLRPAGNIEELAMALLLDGISCSLMLKKKVGLQELKDRHANLL